MNLKKNFFHNLLLLRFLFFYFKNLCGFFIRKELSYIFYTKKKHGVWSKSRIVPELDVST